MDQPDYQPLSQADTPVIFSDDRLVKINVVAGELGYIKGPVKSLSAVNTFTVEMKKGGKYYFRIPPAHNLFVYLLDGQVNINDNHAADAKFAVLFNNDGEGFDVEALENTRLFIGSGEPLNEPLATHGPFVMNSQTQIMEAFRDYQMGKMGVLIED